MAMNPLYDPLLFNHIPEGTESKRDLIATYYIDDALPGEDFIDHLKLIQEIIIEGSTGSWMKVKEETPEVREALAGKLLGYYEVPCEDQSRKKAVIQLGFPIDAWEGNIPMMLLSIAGNCWAFSKNLRLLDVKIPDELLGKFKGPKFGVEGVRALTGVPQRPLVLHIIKPKMGALPEAVANQVYETAIGGADLAKDDEMTSDVFNSKFEDRLSAVLKAVKRAKDKTGRELIYFCSITDEVDEIQEKARKAVRMGAKGLLLTFSAGLSALRVLAKDPEVNVPIILHVSHMLALLPKMNFPVLAKLCRLCGADLILTPSLWGQTPVASLEEALRTAQTLLAPMQHIKRTFPMPGGGVYPGLVPTLMHEFGPDIVLMAGGGMLGHPKGYTAGAKAFVDAANATLNDIPLPEAAKNSPELQVALERWGSIKRPTTPWLRVSPKYHPKVEGI
jgi:2,3-diketo-5-methylthiopentyl-1-phosphate enolase